MNLCSCYATYEPLDSMVGNERSVKVQIASLSAELENDQASAGSMLANRGEILPKNPASSPTCGGMNCKGGEGI